MKIYSALGLVMVVGIYGCKQSAAVLDRQLIDACTHGKLADAKMALAAGANPNAVDPDPDRGFTALGLAAEHPKIVEVLLKAGASPTKPDARGLLPITCAAVSGSVESVDLLVKAGAKVDEKGSNGETALMDAARSEYLEVAKYLIEHGAEVNAADNMGLTPLCYSVRVSVSKPGGQTAMVRYLVEHGADVSLKDVHGSTALELAQDKRFRRNKTNLEVIELLKAAAKKPKSK